MRFGFLGNLPARLESKGFGRLQGSYSVDVIATSENTGARKKHIEWHWDGTLEGLRITSR
jgi:hypothetical protein